MSKQREADLDGELHVEGECCRDYGRCRKCRARLHYQPLNDDGCIELCEGSVGVWW